MKTYVALLRAVNVGGTGKLPMAELREMCEGVGFEAVRTYIASGNVVFESGESAEECRTVLEASLEAHAGKSVDVFIRTGTEISALVEANPFAGQPGNRVMVHFLAGEPPAELAAGARGQKNEVIEPGPGVVYIHYPDGMGRSKLSLDIGVSTARNMNTVAKLAGMAA